MQEVHVSDCLMYVQRWTIKTASQLLWRDLHKDLGCLTWDGGKWCVVNKQVLFLDVWTLDGVEAFRRAFTCWLLQRNILFSGDAFAAEIPADPPPSFFCSPRCCLSHIYFSVTVWGQLGWKLRVGERGSAGFNYQLSKYVVLHVCASVCVSRD